MTDLVSVYIPTKNRVSLLKRAINSVLAQTVRNIELIIVSDGSEDETNDYVNSIRSDMRIRLIKNEKSRGACVARNQAIELAEGRFVTGLDDDDYFMPHRIESFIKTWKKLEEAGTVFSCLFDRRIVDAGKEVWVWDLEPIVSKERILLSNAVGNQVFTTRERMLKAGLYDPDMPAWQDWDLWVRLVKTFGSAQNIKEHTYLMDATHELARITNKSSEKIINAARLFYKKYCVQENLPAVLLSLGNYTQIKLSVNDLMVLLSKGKFRFVIRKIVKGEFKISFKSSVL